MTNSFYNTTGTPVTASFGSSAAIRAEFAAIAAGFDKFPTLSGNANKAVVINSLASGLTVTTGTLALGGNVSIGANFTTSASSVVSISGNFTTNGAISTSGAVTLAGALTTAAAVTFSGAHAFTATLTNTTSVTFPTSGTLATTTTPAASIVVGTTAVTSGTSGRVLYNNANTLGEMTTSGSGTELALTNSPTFTTPTLGAATATSINKLAVTAPATSATLTIADGKTLTASNTLTLTATDGATLAIGAGGTLASAAYVATGTAGATIPLLNGTNTWSAAQAFQAGTTTLGVQQTTRGALVLSNTAAGAFACTLQSSNSATVATTLTMPPDAGVSGYYLQTNGSGTLTWAAATASGSGGATASGNVTLTNTSDGAQSITTTAYGQSVTLPDATTMPEAGNNYNITNVGPYPLTIKANGGNILGFLYQGQSAMVGLASNATAAGVWTITSIDLMAVTANLWATALYNLSVAKRTAIDSNRTLITLGSGTSNLYGVVYDASSQTWGTPTLIRTSAGNHVALLYTTDRVLVCSCNGTTAFEAVVLSLSGTTITVNTAATATLSANLSAQSMANLVAVGSSYVVSYRVDTPAAQIRAMTISGTTVTIGSATVLSGTTVTSGSYLYLTAVTTSVLLTIGITAGSTIYATPYTISGTTISLGTGATIAVNASTDKFRVLPISSGARWVIAYLNSAGTGMDAAVISVSGTTATTSTVTACTSGTWAISNMAMFVTGSKLVIYQASTGRANIVTDSSGTASAGTAITVPGTTSYLVEFVRVDSNIATFVVANSSNLATMAVRLTVSGTSAVLTEAFRFNDGMTQSFPSLNGAPYSTARSVAYSLGTLCYSAAGISTGARRLLVSGAGATSTEITRFFPAIDPSTALPGDNNEFWLYQSDVGDGASGQIQRVQGIT